MFSSLRISCLIATLIGIAIVFGCSKEKTTSPATNNPPAAPYDPLPVHDASNIDLAPLLLCWHCSDPDGDTIRYDVYFDTLPNPALVSSNQLFTTYPVNHLEIRREYYWKVVSRDEHGSESASPVWHFSTVMEAERIVFESERNGIYEILIMYANGSNVRNITPGLQYADGPSISNDGVKIAYFGFSSSDWNYHIYTMNNDGTGVFQVTRASRTDCNPVWSPDGAKIAFMVQGILKKGNPLGCVYALYIVDANGENTHAITDFIIPDGGPKCSWSPQGQEIAFVGDSVYSDYHTIFKINSDGANMQQLTSCANWDFEPAWSHDGTRIAFTRYEDRNRYQIYLMNADGSNQHNISNSQWSERQASWSPDDSKIAYSSYTDGDNDIYVMNSDGTNKHNITNTPGYDSYPSWGPWHR